MPVYRLNRYADKFNQTASASERAAATEGLRVLFDAVKKSGGPTLICYRSPKMKKARVEPLHADAMICFGRKRQPFIRQLRADGSSVASINIVDILHLNTTRTIDSVIGISPAVPPAAGPST
jgi:hypothetical protein